MLGKLFSATFSFLGTLILSAVVTGVIFGLLFLALKALKAISL